MTTKELIAVLKKQPEDNDVIFANAEGDEYTDFMVESGFGGTLIKQF